MIPFYEHPEWTPCPRMPITLNNQLCFADDTTPKGESWQRVRGQVQRAGMLDGRAYEFMLTHGQGRGVVQRYYLYFRYDGKLYFVFTGDSWPGSIDIRTAV
ncbi:hypothetical protein [Paraburkholderia saeva]|uniref:hypothetical protein n=1 Tax=Paraburkholderia saeva TaxID=2777537 RepID=UPI001D82F723|nr:hypothetical protein [Paraburkholderia saeva]CAG4890757.1 hypothetical protein R52603_01004 [Paraburkholderia saeva]